MYGKVLALVREHASGKEAVRLATEYRQYPLQLGFTPYNRGMEWVRDTYARQGLNAEAPSRPADGKTVYGDRHFPLAWDVDEAWLKVADPDFPEPTLADYQEDPYGVVPFCAATDGVQEGVLVPVGVLRDKGTPPGQTNVVVLFDKYPMPPDIRWALGLGCKACVAHVAAPRGKPVAYNARRWFNDMFGEGHVDARQPTMPAFSISSRQAAALVERYERSGPIPVTYLVRARAYAGEALTATGQIPGREQPEVEVLATAHAYEPNTSNNVTGVAICLEAARVLMHLIDSGDLPRPRRSIRFFHGFEQFSLLEHALRHRESFGAALCGITVDCMGTRDVLGARETLHLYRGYDFNPSFLNGLFAAIGQDCARQARCALEVVDGYSGNDNVVQDPLFGPAWAMVNGSVAMDAGFYHTNADTPEHLSPERMAEYAALVAATLHFVADAGAEEARYVAGLARDEAATRFARIASHAASAAMGEPASIHAAAAKFEAFCDVARPAGAAAVQSAAKLVPEGEREGFRDQIAPIEQSWTQLSRQISSAVRSALAAAAGCGVKQLQKTPMDDLERQAAHMIPRRKLPGAVGLGTLTPEARAEAARLIGGSFEQTYSGHHEFWHYFAPQLFWLDGKRSVRDAALAHWSLAGWTRPEPPGARRTTVEQFLRIVEFLERQGHVEIERRPIPTSVTKADICKGLGEIGIRAGDLVLVHSSLSQFGHVAGGADTVIDALLGTVGAKGIVAMPTFTCTAVGEAEPPFDPATSPVYTGKISETFWRRQGVLRSWQPTHSIAAAGDRAAEFLESEDPYDTFDRHGPWGKLLDRNGKILFFGETMGANTYMHALEAWFLNYLDLAFARVKDGDTEKEVYITNYPDGCRGRWYSLRREAEYFKRLRPLNLYRETRIGAAAALVIEVQPFTRALHALLVGEPDLFLHKSGCLRCAERRAKLAGWRVPDYPA